jgi:serine/threonine protein kinase
VTFEVQRFDTEVSSTAFDGRPFILRSNELPPNVTIITKDANSSTAQNEPFISDRFNNPIHRQSFSSSIVEYYRTSEDCQLIANIAETFFTRVDRYLDTSSNIELAIKTYRTRSPTDKIAIEYGWRELEILMKLHHPCMIEFVGFSPGNRIEGFKIATVYVEGCSLKEVLVSTPSWLDWTTKSRIISGIVLCLRYIHSKGIIHRDLKPSNILIEGQDYSVRICDFHISRLSSIEKLLSQFVGTPQYLSPELYEMGEDGEGHSNPAPTEKADVFFPQLD